MIFHIHKPSLYDLKLHIKKGTLVIAKDTDFDLTEGRIYVAESDMGENTFPDCFFVKNDEGEIVDYTGEYFALYEGERVASND